MKIHDTVFGRYLLVLAVLASVPLGLGVIGAVYQCTHVTTAQPPEQRPAVTGETAREMLERLRAEQRASDAFDGLDEPRVWCARQCRAAAETPLLNALALASVVLLFAFVSMTVRFVWKGRFLP